MLNRLFKYNRFFSGLFLLSFFVSFIIMYYGLDLNRQIIQVNEVREQSAYRYGCKISAGFTEDITSVYDIKEDMMPHGGNIIFQCSGPIGNGVINVDDIEILWEQNEELLTPVIYEDYYLNGDVDALDVPKCIIGDAWEGDTYVIDGIRYVKVFQIESCVVGEYVPYTFTGYDERCLVFKDSLSQEELNKLLFSLGGITVTYESNLSDETERFKEWIQPLLDNIWEWELEADEWADAFDIFGFSDYMSSYRKIYTGIQVMCFVNCAFLAYFWGKTHMYEYMLKRTLGYGRLHLLMDIISQFALLEVFALGAVLLLTCGYELISGDIVTWYDNISLGFMQMVLIFAVFGLALSAFPMIQIMRLKPADVLKSTE